MAVVNRFEIYLLNMDDVPSSQAKNTRRCVVTSPDEMNHNVAHSIIAPISSPAARYPTHVPVELLGSERAVILDQMRAVDNSRLVKKIGEIDGAARKEITDRLCEFFAE